MELAKELIGPICAHPWCTVYIVIPLDHLLRNRFDLTRDPFSGTLSYFVQMKSDDDVLRVNPFHPDTFYDEIVAFVKSIPTDRLSSCLSRFHIMWDVGLASWGGQWASFMAPSIQPLAVTEQLIQSVVIESIRNDNVFEESVRSFGSVGFMKPTVPDHKSSNGSRATPQSHCRKQWGRSWQGGSPLCRSIPAGRSHRGQTSGTP